MPLIGSLEFVGYCEGVLLWGSGNCASQLMNSPDVHVPQLSELHRFFNWGFVKGSSRVSKIFVRFESRQVRSDVLEGDRTFYIWRFHRCHRPLKPEKFPMFINIKLFTGLLHGSLNRTTINALIYKVLIEVDLSVLGREIWHFHIMLAKLYLRIRVHTWIPDTLCSLLDCCVLNWERRRSIIFFFFYFHNDLR